MGVPQGVGLGVCVCVGVGMGVAPAQLREPYLRLRRHNLCQMISAAILTLLLLLTLERLVVWQELARVYHPKGAGRYCVGCQGNRSARQRWRRTAGWRWHARTAGSGGDGGALAPSGHSLLAFSLTCVTVRLESTVRLKSCGTSGPSSFRVSDMASPPHPSGRPLSRWNYSSRALLHAVGLLSVSVLQEERAQYERDNQRTYEESGWYSRQAGTVGGSAS